MAYVKEGITREDCEGLATRLRSEDIKEILAIRPNGSLSDSLLESAVVSYKTFSVMEEGVGCIAVFGVRESPLGGIPWLLTSDLLFERSCRKFIRQCKGYVSQLTDDFDYCFNYVAVTNIKAHRWLTWMGFNLNKSYTHTINGVDFHPFTFVRNK